MSRFINDKWPEDFQPQDEVLYDDYDPLSGRDPDEDCPEYEETDDESPCDRCGEDVEDCHCWDGLIGWED